jgi:tetratricopeptide (TPR) repeat protein
MPFLPIAFRALLVTVPLQFATAETLQLVLKNGRSVPVAALSIQGDTFTVKTAVSGFNVGQTIPLTLADHIYGDKPALINQAIALNLTGKPKEARDMLLPVVKEHAITAKIPGNFWLEASRSLLVAHALNGETANTTALGKEIAEATTAQGIEPFVLLGKALLLPATTSFQDRDNALRDLTIDSMPENLRACASYFRGKLLSEEKKKPEALEIYLSVPCLYPSGGVIFNAGAEIQAADLLAELNRREEAILLIKSALHATKGTILESLAISRIENLK